MNALNRLFGGELRVDIPLFHKFRHFIGPSYGTVVEENTHCIIAGKANHKFVCEAD